MRRQPRPKTNPATLLARAEAAGGWRSRWQVIEGLASMVPVHCRGLAGICSQPLDLSRPLLDLPLLLVLFLKLGSDFAS